MFGLLWADLADPVSAGLAVAATASSSTDGFSNLMSGLIGALLGGATAFVGALYIQHREQHRAGRDAARAVFFELVLSRSVLSASRTVGALIPQPLERQAWDSTLPRLSGWLRADDLMNVFNAYLDVASVQAQYSVGERLGTEGEAMFAKAVEDMSRAIAVLNDLAFNRDEKKRAMALMHQQAAEAGYDLAEAVKADADRDASNGT